MISSFFVYGTLKRGQCRDQCWPATPLSISAAWVKGQLFSRPDYPAMIAGEDRIIGELWTFDSNDMDQVVRVLDQIEGINQANKADLYRRVVSAVFDMEDQFLTQAYTYLYETNPAQDGYTRVIGTTVSWP